jgi:hypothetical protein
VDLDERRVAVEWGFVGSLDGLEYEGVLDPEVHEGVRDALEERAVGNTDREARAEDRGDDLLEYV